MQITTDPVNVKNVQFLPLQQYIPLIHTANRKHEGCAIVQAVSRRLLTAVARARAQVKSCGICGGQSGIGVGIPQVLRVSPTILIPLTAQHSYIDQGWYNRSVSGRRTKCTQSHPTPRKITASNETFHK
jgi:hypothetical protein